MAQFLERFRQNFSSGLAVSLVSIPLSLSLAIASGATPTQGIITAVWAGLLGSLFGGSSYNIFGPTGALAGILITFSMIHGYAQLSLVALLSGCMILVGYFLKLDRYIVFIPRSVVMGFTLGISFIIVSTQIYHAFGLSDLGKTGHILEDFFILLNAVSSIHWGVFLVFLLGVGFIFFWRKKVPRVPAPIVISMIGIVGAMLVRHYSSDVTVFVLSDFHPDLLHARLWAGYLFDAPLSYLLQRDIWTVSFATAIVAILETLLSGQVADKMTGTKFDRSKELLGLALANMGSGLLGGIPATAVLARTALNVRSGASHRMSGVISAVCIAFISVTCMGFLQYLPLVVIASILVVVAIGMIEKKHFIHLIESERAAFALSMVVAIITIVDDPITGILVGSFIALLIFVNRVAYGQTEITFYLKGHVVETVLKDELPKRDDIVSDVVVYHLSGTLTYINMPAHLQTLSKIKGNKVVILSLKHTFYADSEGIGYLNEIIQILQDTNEKIVLSGVNKEVRKLLVKEPFYKRKCVEGKIFQDVNEALNATRVS